MMTRTAGGANDGMMTTTPRCVDRATKDRRLLQRFVLVGLGIALGTGAAITGCVSIDEIAPPVNEPILDVAESMGVDRVTVARGRVIYLTSCTECHRAFPIDDYSIDEWRPIFEDMARQSSLDARQNDELWDYIRVAHEYLTTGATNSTPTGP